MLTNYYNHDCRVTEWLRNQIIENRLLMPYQSKQGRWQSSGSSVTL